MDKKYAINYIVDGMRLYFYTLARADNMIYHEGNIEYIIPKPPGVGPALIFHASLSEENVYYQVEKVITGIKAGVIPSLWTVTMASKPDNLKDVLISKGFVQSKTDELEPGMALFIQDAPVWPDIPNDIIIKRVKTITEFQLWVDVVNEALHGWKMLDAKQYYHLVTLENLGFYLAYMHGQPVATSSTIQNGNISSIEFVSTLAAFRNKGIGTAVSVAALRDLRDKGVHTVTLRAAINAISLYRRLGFNSYCDVIELYYKEK